MERDDLFIEMREAVRDVRKLLRNHDCPRSKVLGTIRYCATCKFRSYLKDLLTRTRNEAHRIAANE